MARRRRLEYAHQQWMDWADWTKRTLDHANCLGYPRHSVEARMAEYGTTVSHGRSGSKDPECITKPHVTRINRLYQSLDHEMRLAVCCYYCAPSTHRVKVWTKLSGKAARTLSQRIDQLHWMTAGALAVE